MEITISMKIGFPYYFQLQGDLMVSKRTGTEIQFRTLKHLPHPDTFVKLFETSCLWISIYN